MWKALFLAIGISMFILGLECLAVKKFTMKTVDKPAAASSDNLFPSAPRPAVRREYIVVDHAPWSLMGLGAVIIIYAFDLPRRMNA